MKSNYLKNLITIGICSSVLLSVSQIEAAQSTATAAATELTVEIGADATSTSKTELTVQVCPEPPMRRGGVIHDQAMTQLRDLGVSYARLQPWFPYPKLGIAELDPPRNGKTSWDFSLIDPIVLDFYQAQQGRPIVLNMPIPGWLFKQPPHAYPQDPNDIDWAYEIGPNVGSELRDPSYQKIADYFRRVAQWYIRGGFKDEYGIQHAGGHHLKVDYWEVLNEQDEGGAHQLDPPTYTGIYDAVVSELRQVDPTMKFSALALSDPDNIHYFEYFLNAKNHKPNIPLDMVSYHHYVVAEAGRTLPDWQHDMFADADRFLLTVHRIERIRRRLSAHTRTFISEFGLMWGEEMENVGQATKLGRAIPDSPKIPDTYWTLGASVFAYGYLGAIREGVDLVGAAELVDYPQQMAGTNLIDWNTGQPNAVYRVVKLLHEELPPGATLLRTSIQGKTVAAQAFQTPQGRKLLLINKTLKLVKVRLPAATGASTRTIDMTSRSAPPRQGQLKSDDLALQPQAVTIVIWR